jgi:hypothetical protein
VGDQAPAEHEVNAMLRAFLLALAIAVPLLSSAPLSAAGPAPAPALATFAFEEQAQKHCPSDAVVWLNLPTGIYHLKGTRWYGRTTNGAYVCDKEAEAAGDRGALNGRRWPVTGRVI